MDRLREYAEDPTKFKKLSLEDQLSLFADLILYWADKESQAMAEYGKSSIEAKRCYDRKKYWEHLNQNVKKLAEIETAKIRQNI